MLIPEYLAEANQTNVSLALQLGVPASLLSQWANGIRPVPAARCLAIERATAGKVRCEELRPDVDWTRTPLLHDDDQGSEGQPIPDAAVHPVPVAA
jgi:DNA-binding transcriptional regulator YdaS (Cro superfamily)